MQHSYIKFKSPVGLLTLVASTDALIAILWEDDTNTRVPIDHGVKSPCHPILIEAKKQLQQYFQGERLSFSLPLNPYGTDFQKKVWIQLTKIPYGKTISYSELATKIKNPKASRAVGAANGKNPISIIIPCHRVIGKSGKLTGFAGGLDIKSHLINLERQ